jgi:hypothetical protein
MDILEIVLLLIFFALLLVVKQIMFLRKDLALLNLKTRESIRDHKHDVIDKLNDVIVQLQVNDHK